MAVLVGIGIVQHGELLLLQVVSIRLHHIMNPPAFRETRMKHSSSWTNISSSLRTRLWPAELSVSVQTRNTQPETMAVGESSPVVAFSREKKKLRSLCSRLLVGFASIESPLTRTAVRSDAPLALHGRGHHHPVGRDADVDPHHVRHDNSAAAVAVGAIREFVWWVWREQAEAETQHTE